MLPFTEKITREAIRRTSQTTTVNYPHANNETEPLISSTQSKASPHSTALPAPHGLLKEIYF